MQLQTLVEIPKVPFQISHTDKLLLLGSCFADEMGEKLTANGFQVMANPIDTLYKPASIAAMLLRCISERECTEIFAGSDGIWHSWMHHSRFSATTKDELQARIDNATQEAAAFLRTANVLIITFGTAIIYRLKENGMLVANCHKQPDSLFLRERLTAYDIVDQWQMVLQLLLAVNPDLKIIFTVSPIRHKRDGLHVNQISKGILLQAVDEMVNYEIRNSKSENSDQLSNCKLSNCKLSNCDFFYFPSYEIMLDELRDYRFYAEDMVHPSPLAIEYIWQRFQQSYMSPQTIEQCRQNLKHWKQTQHRTIIKNLD